MKVLTTVFATTCLMASSQAATNYLPKAGPGNQCEAADTYNQCIDNGLATICSPTDNDCNCKQSQILIACVNYCSKDRGISGLGGAQQSEVTKWCSAASSASLTSTSTDIALKPSNSQPSSASSSKTASVTSPTASSGPAGGKSGAGKMEMCMGLLGIVAVISSLV